MREQLLTRDEKIAKIIREGHKIAKKLKNVKAIEELESLSSEIDSFKKYANAEFGTYTQDLENDNGKYCHLSMELSMVVEEKEMQLVYHPDKAEVAKRSIEQEFEKYLDYGDWQLTGKSAE